MRVPAIPPKPAIVIIVIIIIKSSSINHHHVTLQRALYVLGNGCFHYTAKQCCEVSTILIFIDKETKVQRGAVTCLSIHSP